MSQPRHKRKAPIGRPLADGDRLRVSRLLATGETIEYDVIYHADERGRAVFDRVRTAYSGTVREVVLFLAAEDLRILDWPDFLAISDFPVEVSEATGRESMKNTGGRTMTRKVMDHIQI